MADEKAHDPADKLAMKPATFEELVESIINGLDPGAEQLLRAASDTKSLDAAIEKQLGETSGD
ncbi:MAG TPA: hypothetical protein VFI17_09860 [Solirubrobacterales bacterium]|nr:hypothetical protein [Solirubrobacterales bacterium]